MIRMVPDIMTPYLYDISHVYTVPGAWYRLSTLHRHRNLWAAVNLKLLGAACHCEHRHKIDGLEHFTVSMSQAQVYRSPSTYGPYMRPYEVASIGRCCLVLALSGQFALS